MNNELNFLKAFFEANKLTVAFWTAIFGAVLSLFQSYRNYRNNKLNVDIRIMQTWPMNVNGIGGCLHVFFLISNYSARPVIIDSIELIQGDKCLKPIRNGEKVVTVKWNDGYETMCSIPFPYSIGARSTITEYVTYHDHLTIGIDFDKPVTARILLDRKKRLEIRIDKWNLRESNLSRILFGSYHFPEK